MNTAAPSPDQPPTAAWPHHHAPPKTPPVKRPRNHCPILCIFPTYPTSTDYCSTPLSNDMSLRQLATYLNLSHHNLCSTANRPNFCASGKYVPKTGALQKYRHPNCALTPTSLPPTPLFRHNAPNSLAGLHIESIRISIFEFVSDFVLRISTFLPPGNLKTTSKKQP